MRILPIALIISLCLLAACQPAPTTTTAPQVAPTLAPAAASTSAQPSAPTAPAGPQVIVPTTAPAAKAGALTPIRFAVLPVADVLPFYVAEQNGYFKDAGLDVQLVPVASAAERDQVLQSGQVDGVLTDLITPITFNAEQPRVKVVRKARQAFPDQPLFRLVTGPNSGVNTVADLKGQPIGISENSVIAYWADRILTQEGLTKADLQTQAVPNVATRAQLVAQGQLKGAILPDPFASLIVLQGGKVIQDDTKYPQIGQSVIVFRNETITRNADAVRRFLQAYDKAVGDLRARPEEFRSLLVEKGRVPDPLRATFPIPKYPDPSVPTQAEFDDVVKWAVEKGIVKQPVPYTAAVDTTFVK